jgi:hypothetical protein
MARQWPENAKLRVLSHSGIPIGDLHMPPTTENANLANCARRGSAADGLSPTRIREKQQTGTLQVCIPVLKNARFVDK